MKQGFTLVETLVVISIISILVAIGAVSLLNSRNKNALTEGQTTVMRTFEEARSSALSGVGTGGDYCVKIDTSTITLYTGTFTGTPPTCTGGTTIKSTALLSPISTDQTTASNFVFKRITGASSQGKTITLTNSITSATAKVTIMTSGQIFPY